ncbi:MAG: hypothetical protein ACRC5A_05440 [Enterobacteriaceae bacterium]
MLISNNQMAPNILLDEAIATIAVCQCELSDLKQQRELHGDGPYTDIKILIIERLLNNAWDVLEQLHLGKEATCEQ